MRILITDSDSRPALAATRSLGRKGHVVITAGTDAASLASVSKYSAGFVRYPSPAQHTKEFVATILRAIEDQRIDMLLPVTEVTTLLLTEQRAAIEPRCALPFADAATIADASNKARMVEVAAELGVPTPATVRIDNPEALSSVEPPGYPTVLKPARSRVHTGSTWINNSVSYASDRQDLERRVKGLPRAAFPLLLQERIKGPGVGFFACYDRGRLIATFAHRRLREKPPSGGVSTLCESTPVDSEALEHGTRLLERLAWHGVAMVEFKRDQRDGRLRLMEINARLWGSLQLAIFSGVDFPAILANIASGNPPSLMPTYRIGARSRWLLGDLDVALMLLFRSSRQLNLPDDFPPRWRALAEMLHVAIGREHWEAWDRDDPQPWRLEFRGRLAQLMSIGRSPQRDP